MLRHRLVRPDGSPICDLRLAHTFWERLAGSALGLEAGLLLKTNAVHLFWGPAPLDLIFLGPDLTVMRVDQNVPRGRIRRCGGAAFVVEIRSGRLPEPLPEKGQRLLIVTGNLDLTGAIGSR